MKVKFLIISLLIISWFSAGCSPSRVEFDKKGMTEMKNVAVVMYSVPPSINYRDNPREPGKKSLLQLATDVATANNGPKAAAAASATFIEGVNKGGLNIKLMPFDTMMGNAKFRALASNYVKLIEEEKAKAAEELNKSSAGKALNMLGSLSSAMGGSGVNQNEGVGPEGIPSWGVQRQWGGAKTAIMGGASEKKFLKEALEALGVDGVMVVNDPGMSFTCEFCVGGTGSGSTGSAFLVTLVGKNEKSILEMRQWFLTSNNSAAMAAYAVNPLQHESLFKGHGEKMAQVYVDYYKEEGGQ